MKSLLLLAGLCAARAVGAAVTVSSELSRSQVALGDQTVLSVTIAGDQASLPTPNLPPLESFSVYDSGRSQSLNFVNGHISASVVYTYILSPRAVGKFRIPAISADGASAPSAAIDVEVTPAGTAPAGGTPAPAGHANATPRVRGNAKDIFVVAFLDKSRVYVNQQVTLTVRFLDSIPLIGDIRYEPPQTTGFLSEPLPPVRNGTTAIGGRPYQFSEIKVALFPIQPGRLTIGPALIHCQVPSYGGASGQDFFDRFFAMATPRAVTLNSDPVTVQVDPLPPDKPDDFTGIVGRLTARASTDRNTVRAGEAVSLTVFLSGTGNVKSLPEPKKPDLPALRFFETETSATVDKANDRVGGTKTFRTVAVPRVSGPAQIPPLTFSYFDPERKTYARAQTDAIALNVLPGAPGMAPPAASAAAASAAAPTLTAIADDIRYLKIAPERAPLSAALGGFADLGPWHALPFAAFLCAAAWAWRRRVADSDPHGRRFRAALARAEARIKTASALPPDESARAAALAGEALAGFVADKLGLPTAGLTLKAACEALCALPKPPSEAALERLRTAWQEADLRRFAPGAAGADARRFATELIALLKTLDQELRR